MMYFCPCPCTDPLDPETEESTFLALPRNLSYVQDSYLDPHSLSARFVHNPKIERTFRNNVPQANDGKGEDEHADLLSVVKAQEFPVRCGSELFPRSSSGQDTTVSISGPLLPPSSSDTSPSRLARPATGSLVSTLQSQARLAELLSSPPWDSPSELLDIGSSVDGEQKSQVSSEQAEVASTVLRSPDHRGLQIDRGEDLCEGVLQKSCHSDCNQSWTNCDHMPVFENTITFMNLEEFEGVGDMDRRAEPEEQNENCVRDEEFPRHRMDTPYKSSIVDANGDASIHDNEAHRKLRSNTVSSSNSYESPDSDGFSEEGVFVNMADDLDSNNDKSATVSDVSDDTCVSVDSMFLSPEEAELEEEETNKSDRKMTLEEAINRAALDLNKMGMVMYPECLGSVEPKASDCPEQVDGNQESVVSSQGRKYPARTNSDLSLPFSQESFDSQNNPPSTDTCLSESPLFDDHEFNFSKGKLRKSSSLKTNKTPPGTPHRKKVVRFADAMGLDLESVRHVLNMESPPRIPLSAMADLREGLHEDRTGIGSKFLSACFNQPGAMDNFMHRVTSQKVSLENAIITDLTITGFVRVANVSYHKSVRVRYTHNDWATFHDIAASYVQNSCDGPTDRFSFSIVAPAHFVTGCRLQFAVSYNAGGLEYWDNNGGRNYTFECFGKTVPTENESGWMHFL